MMAQNEERIDACQRANSSFAPHAYDFYRHSVFYAGGGGECNSRAKSIWVGLRFCRAMRFADDWNVLELFGHLLAQAPAPHIAREQHLNSCGERHGENRPK